MTSILQAEREAVAATLRAAGLPVSLNPTSVDPPGVLVDAPAFERTAVMGGCVKLAVTIPIVVVGSQSTGNEGVAKMLELVEAVLAALPRTADPDSGGAFTEPFERGGMSPLPAYRLSVSRNVEIPTS